MIKWFDADKFLPGKDIGEVLIRKIEGEVINVPYYDIGFYKDGQWNALNHREIMSTSRVTHWAHINEPFE